MYISIWCQLVLVDIGQKHKNSLILMSDLLKINHTIRVICVIVEERQANRDLLSTWELVCDKYACCFS